MIHLQDSNARSLHKILQLRQLSEICLSRVYLCCLSLQGRKMHIVSLFTATVEINGASYAGGPANSKEEAASKAGCESFQLTPTIPIPYPVLNFKLKAQ